MLPKYVILSLKEKKKKKGLRFSGFYAGNQLQHGMKTPFHAFV